MFERFGEFDSAAEINETAVNLRKEGDTDSLKVLAEENGIDQVLVLYSANNFNTDGNLFKLGL